jgi:NAD(P)-dependent dehydrogenase (short-subunit alcohol dehydrogenase family)
VLASQSIKVAVQIGVERFGRIDVDINNAGFGNIGSVEDTSGFIETLATEVGPLGIQLTAVEPGGMKTAFAEDSSLTIIPSPPAYDATAGATARMMKAPNYLD